MFSRSFCGTRTIVSENQDFLAFGCLDSVETECANNKMGVLRKGFTHLFAYWPSYRSTVLPGHRQG
jgi:hypothetical protein